MSFQRASYETLANEAASQPVAMVTAMAERDGSNEGGLTLSREHIVTINQYANFVFGLPKTPQTVEQWLGYKTIDEPELKPSAMSSLFEGLRRHANAWTTLSDRSKRLSSELATTANLIDVVGEEIVAECSRLRFLKPQMTWEQVALARPVKLGAEDQKAVTQLVEYMQILNDDVRNYAKRVDGVKKDSEAFRDTVKKELLPAVGNKDKALKRKKQDGLVEALRTELKALDVEIGELKKEYDRYLSNGLSSLAGGPLGAIVGGAIYGAKAESARKQRKKLEQQRRGVAAKLKARVNLEGRLKEMTQFVDDLDVRLNDVLTSASHLQTVWERVEVYITSSIEELGKITDGQRLAIFLIFFKRFLRQWKEIERTSLQLTAVFDNAASAR
ncbi:alpha-xenorhabdolysin family binary toxin subunit A [Pseudomonas guariconensis]|uniref:Binary cytotoxin component n=1 Tax=Pseudomonas guariconensis TaxID=1288410 RepID=A0AAX0VX96_9PSED|nr:MULTISPECIES: alpha-xenorhabdolysin family binary toxin subunit A [Pseudomonas]MBH3357924.1 alpha-xenorhabdolysin family binary toxin subunit A [Pseudomonas guariconensis]MCO7621643.1 alpha-xenorhabdolysin family binary toxin subunit A [Pseudomonas guariconensis]MEB3841658.1 alpha-xenorhabdolysin family binary toxin subunit A [Pseudomonas guariconensis]MEB3874526.1 alpha-xenorhabdolysin family binary toxin subunit A [Pseudomonas guariconensis]MEB3880126.1 alpha-xenorhabdolysin family binary